VRRQADPRAELARITGLTRRELECYEDELVLSWAAAEMTDELAWRIRRVRRLREHLGLDYEAVEIILRLTETIEQLQAAMARLSAADDWPDGY
jgi:hypothetical protein